jgi:hypothetical protein
MIVGSASVDSRRRISSVLITINSPILSPRNSQLAVVTQACIGIALASFTPMGVPHPDTAS